MNMKKILGTIVASAVAASALVMPTSADDTYHAGLIFQTSEWMYRDFLDDDEIQGDAVPDDADTTFVDAEIKGDGEYTVEIKDLPESALPWHSLCLLTDIPYSENISIEVTAVEGGTLNAANKPAYEDSKGVFKANFINEWNDGVKETPVISFDAAPTNVKVTFKISGLGGAPDNSDKTDATDSGDATNAPAANPGSEGKPSTDTGIEGVAVVAGLAVLATGAIVIAKKRK